MRLEASGLACVRGGREVFTGLGFSVGQGEALLVKDAPMIYSLAPAPADATPADTAAPARSVPASTSN